MAGMTMDAWVEHIQEEVLKEINQGRCISDEEIKDYIEECVLKAGHEAYLPIEVKHQVARDVFCALRRLDILQELLDNPKITEIMINGPEHIFVEENGKISEYPRHFRSRQKLEDVIQQIVAKMNRVVNEANPIVDVRLHDGSRVNVVLPPVAINGPVVTIRKFPEHPITMDKLIAFGSITEEANQFLKVLVEARYNIFISGGTGSGKTTFLNALTNYVPNTERIITVEDSAELQIQDVPNLVRLEVRNGNVEGKNGISIRDLMKSALRMRPDRIVLGEVRDSAAIDLLSAMNTGHDGSLSTGHANSTIDMLHRLETLVLMGMNIPLPAVRSQIASAIDIVVQLGRLRDKTRKVLEISEICGIKDGEIEVQPIFQFIETGEDENGRVQGSLQWTRTSLLHQNKLSMAGKEWKWEGK